MADKPIPFLAPMVLALLDGRKTQERRLLPAKVRQSYVANDNRNSDKPRLVPGMRYWNVSGAVGGKIMLEPDFLRIMPWQAGDRLWVKEAWSGVHAFRDVRPSQRESFATPDGPVLREDVWYWADGNPAGGDYERPRSSIFMPRWASRITLIVEDVKVERLQDISEEDAIAEGLEWVAPTWGVAGIADSWNGNPCQSYSGLCDSINGPGAWDANPWVVAYSFRCIHQNIDEVR